MKWVIIVVGGIVGVVLMVVIIGATLPKAHVASHAIRLKQKPDTVFRTIASVTTAASWRSDIQRVEMLPPHEGRMAWREHSSNGAVAYEAELVRPPVNGLPGRFVTRITDRNLPYGGSWIIDVAPDGPQTLVIATERGEVYNPLFRFVSRYIMGHTASIDAYLKALAKQFGQEVELEEAIPLEMPMAGSKG